MDTQYLRWSDALLIYYAERGQRVGMREFETEEVACNAFLDLVMSDRWVWLP